MERSVPASDLRRVTYRHPEVRFDGMAESVMRAFGVVYIKTGTFERAQHSRCRYYGKLAHTSCGKVTLMVVFTGSNGSILSFGTGSPSFIRLSM